MSTKIFDGFSSGRELEVRGAEDGSQVDLLVRRAGTGIVATGIAIAPSDAPALALAILEAAGADSDLTWSGAKDYGNADHLGWIAGHLGAYIKTQERVTAEPKDKAELEAEALELYNACMGHNLTSWAGMGGKLRDQWLAVARKAREMRAEK